MTLDEIKLEWEKDCVPIKDVPPQPLFTDSLKQSYFYMSDGQGTKPTSIGDQVTSGGVSADTRSLYKRQRKYQQYTHSLLKNR